MCLPILALNAALVLASSLGYLVLAQINNLDVALTFFLGLAPSAFLVAQHENSSDRERRVLLRVAWVAVTGGVLTKGWWRCAAPAALAVRAPAVYDMLSKEGLPMEKIARNLHHVVVRKP